MILTVEYLKSLEPKEFVEEIFLAFHKVLHNVPTDELEEFMMIVIDSTNNKHGELGTQAKEILKYVFILEKEYRERYKL